MVLFRQNSGYVKMLKKKVEGLQIDELKFNENRLLPVEGKLMKLVERSYQLNRAGFYAYGSFLKYYASNLLKSIFKTQ